MQNWPKVIFIILCGFLLVSCKIGHIKQSQNAEERPNIVIIVSDDQGYADVSYHDHPKEVTTPAIDRLANSGVVFTNGYASAYVCAPTRAGLLTGRYQQRFGFYRAPDSRVGLPLSEITLADLLKSEGYATGVFGKWHVGLEAPYHPLQRGFDEFYGFLGHGGHDYFNLNCEEGSAHNCIYKNDRIINDSGYLTDNLAREASYFIEKNAGKSNPFFLYLPFNAVHWPLQALEEDIKKFYTGDGERDILLGMLYRMDLAVDRIISTLKSTKEYENTLIFYFSDNGGAKKNKSNNSPLRDFKHSTYEGGIRVPFIVSWPGKLPPGSSDEPVISLDILPTVCAGVGIDLPTDRVFDGKNMLPVLFGRYQGPLHNQLFWDGNDGYWAVREGDWKLLKNRKGNIELYDLKNDISEAVDLTDRFPDVSNSLKEKYDNWRKEMGEPMRRND